MIGLESYQSVVQDTTPEQRSGRIVRVVGMGLAASGPAVPVGELCRIHSRDGSCEALVTGS